MGWARVCADGVGTSDIDPVINPYYGFDKPPLRGTFLCDVRTTWLGAGRSRADGCLRARARERGRARNRGTELGDGAAVRATLSRGRGEGGTPVRVRVGLGGGEGWRGRRCRRWCW